MPNHFHFLLKQVAPDGLKTFISNVQNAYAKYYNISNERSGPLFQSVFKAVRIETDEQLLHVSRYIHLNPSTNYLVEINNLASYPWSSFRCYLSKDSSIYDFVNTKEILAYFKGKDKYNDFVFDQAAYQRELERVKHLILE